MSNNKKIIFSVTRNENKICVQLILLLDAIGGKLCYPFAVCLCTALSSSA